MKVKEETSDLSHTSPAVVVTCKPMSSASCPTTARFTLHTCAYPASEMNVTYMIPSWYDRKYCRLPHWVVVER